MLRYILVLLLINTSYRSLGNPINPSAPVSLMNSLTTLAGECENKFLSTQIKANTLSCSPLPSVQSEKQLQCFIFYDINKQLCAAVGAGKIILPEEDYTAKVNEEQDVNALCVLAKDWEFSNLTEFSRYKKAVDKVFQHPVTCGKICGVEDFMSDDANYFCKYYKWGLDVLKQAMTTSTQSSVIIAQPPQETANVKDEAALASNDLQDVQIKETTSSTKLDTSASSPLASELQSKVESAKPETSSIAVNKSQSVDPGTVPNVAAAPVMQDNTGSSVNNVEETGAMPDNTLEESKPSSLTEGDERKIDDVPVLVTKAKADDGQIKSDHIQKTEDKGVKQLSSEVDIKQAVLETPKGQVPQGDQDYPDSEEGKEWVSDKQGEDDPDDGDGVDPIEGDLPAEEQKPAQKMETVLSTYTREKESFYANPVQDAFPEDDDDHFFSFFLTAIVLVVLLYILYHNKNKVSKVFFGLMVEGRQAGRRRNSRGHAYRRLDTLEQAMAAGSAAPPAKIIY